MFAIFSIASLKAQNVTTGGYDLSRTNADLSETILSPATVRPSGFGRLFTLSVDGQIYAQPLYMQNVAIAGQSRNVVFVATEHNSVYAFDADAAGPPLWTVNLGPSVPSTSYDTADGPYRDIAPEIGILGTPVIDPSTGTLYVVAATFENGSYYHRLHALDITSGSERFGAPVLITAQVNGTGESSTGGLISFDSLQHIQRPALLLLNGVVYVGFGSHGDGIPWHGWLMGYNASNVQIQTAVFMSTANGWGGALWQSGRGPSADSQGNIYAVTSNGDSDDVVDFSDAVLRLNPANLAIQDWFAPSDQQSIDEDDEDLGSAGAVLVPGTTLLITGGKQGTFYLLDTRSLGQMSSGTSLLPQSLPATGSGVFNLALWSRTDNPMLYILGANASMEAFRISGGQIDSAPASQTSVGFGIPYQGMTISANGTQPGTGILWVADADAWPLPAAGTLHAFNADDLSSELWNSDMVASDALGSFAKFANPTVINGKVYVPTTSDQLVVYGILPTPPPAPVITALVNGASYATGAIAPGEIVTLYGQNPGPQTLTSGVYGPNGNLSTELDGVQVTFNGIGAPLLYVSAGVISAIVPFEVAGSSQASVQVSYNGENSGTQTYKVAAVAPGIFTANSSGSGEAVILNQNSSPNSTSHPAVPGSTIIVYATGGGLTNPVDTTGSVAQSKIPLAAVGSISATIGGHAATVTYAGDAPGKVAGMEEFDIQIPRGVQGSVPVVITVNGVSSQATATIAIESMGQARTSLSRRVRRMP